jgi:YHS domain-containing protein
MRQTAAARSQEPAVTQPPRPAAKKMPTALDGFCPVTLITRHKWQAGDRHWGAYHRGHLYLFAGEAEQKAFLDAPDDYTPAFNGLDPVLAVDHNEKVAGKREYGAFHRQRVYLFSSQETFHRFERDVARYTGETRQARRAASGTASTSTAQNPPRAR